MVTFGERLQELRHKAGLSQAGLAERAGVLVYNLRNWEQDHRQPLWSAFCKLAKALGACCEDFADVEGVAEAPPPAKKRKGGK
jgi:transcriptional regulator with XRE-family HTH domain